MFVHSVHSTKILPFFVVVLLLSLSCTILCVFFSYRSHRTTIRPMRIYIIKCNVFGSMFQFDAANLTTTLLFRMHLPLHLFLLFNLRNASNFQFILIFLPFRVFFLHIFVVWFLTSTYISCTWPN